MLENCEEVLAWNVGGDKCWTCAGSFVKRVMLHDLLSLDCILNTPSSTSVMFGFGMDLALSIFSIQRL